jgi:hypothetical protein
MSILRLATATPKRIPLSEDGDYIDVRSEISKRTFNELIQLMPKGLDGSEESTKNMDMADAFRFQNDLFRIFVTGWSLEADPTPENYEELERSAGEAVDKALGDHFASLAPSDKEADKSA